MTPDVDPRLERRLRTAIRGEVRFDVGSRALYATDSSNYRVPPLGVVIPRDADDVIATVAVSRECRAPVLPRGAGTSLAGQCCGAAVILDCSKYMNAALELDERHKTVRVQPGVVQARLNDALRPHHLWFAPDPSTKEYCNVGGMIGNNSCGPHSVRWGKTVENLESLDVLLYDGTRLRAARTDAAELARIIAAGGRLGDLYRTLRDLRDRYGDLVRARYPKIPRRVSGYNLDELLPANDFHVGRLLVGSEGTLATTLEATLQLVDRPAFRSLVVAGFRNIYEAADAVPEILTWEPTALEGVDDVLVTLCRRYRLNVAGLDLLPEGNGFLFVEFPGASEAEARAHADRFSQSLTRSSHPPRVHIVTKEHDMEQLWRVRESGLGATAINPDGEHAWEGVEDTAVAPARLGEYLRRFRQLVDRHGFRTALYGHFGQACVHNRINANLTTAEGVRQFRTLVEEVMDLVVSFGGSLSGEHGDGVSRGEFLYKMFGHELIEAFRELKRAFDPDGMMNPGKIVDPAPMDANLRLGPSYKPAQPAVFFTYAPDNGFAGAALRCVGVGKCRKTEGGTMCPSYRATRDEMHSTRGRARLLHEALVGDLLTNGMADEHVKQALDLCLSCKACKGECPVHVDMARYKAEFLAHYRMKHRMPLSSHLFGRIHQVARLVMIAPGLANLTAHAPVISGALKRLGGVHPKRELPRVARESFRAWFRRERGAAVGLERPASSSSGDGTDVLLFPDTFTNFFEPHIGIAAVEVLERAGFRVVIPGRDLCCGRPLLDQGMLPTLRRWLEQILATLSPALERGVPVVGLEPSCLLTFRDELVGLFPRDERAERLRDQALLLPELLERHADRFEIGEHCARALVHGHCHQKAIAGMESEKKVLDRIGRLTCEVLDAGCCGMAGSFGYEADHYDVSMVCAGQVLLPAIRRAGPEAILIADGFSCRTQIASATGRRALHLAEFLRQAGVRAVDTTNAVSASAAARPAGARLGEKPAAPAGGSVERVGPRPR